MGDQTTNYVKQFDQDLAHLVQQKTSKLGNSVMTDTLTGEEGYYEQIGPVALDQKSSRFQPVELSDPDMYRRKVVTNPFRKAIGKDSFDAARLLIQQNPNYAMALAAAVARKKDQLIIDKFDATVYGGKDGTTTYSPLSANEVAVNLSGSSEGLTMEKVLRAATILRDNGCDPDIEPWYFACTSKQLEDALKLEKFTSADYSTIKALMAGEISSYLGFEWIIFGRTSGKVALLPHNSSTDVRSCFAWSKSGMLIATAQEPSTVIERRSDLDAWQVLTTMDMGATRLEEEKVVHVLCDEST